MMKPLKRYPGYQINESGNIIDKNNNLLPTAVNNYQMLYVNIEGRVEYIDYLVAETFLVKNGTSVVHVDRDSLNCHLSNLRWADGEVENDIIPGREKRSYSGSYNVYRVYNPDNPEDYVDCVGRGNTALLIQYEEISLKNMVGNGRKISRGPYKGYQIKRLEL